MQKSVDQVGSSFQIQTISLLSFFAQEIEEDNDEDMEPHSSIDNYTGVSIKACRTLVRGQYNNNLESFICRCLLIPSTTKAYGYSNFLEGRNLLSLLQLVHLFLNNHRLSLSHSQHSF